VSIVDELGVPSETGNSIKDALSGRKKLLKQERSDLYEEVFNASSDIKAAPLLTDNIIAAVPSRETLDDLAITSPEAVKQVEAALSRFGVQGAGEGSEVLTVGNFDRLRKVLGNIERADDKGASSVIVGPIRNALDAEADFAIERLASLADGPGGANLDLGVVDTLKEARSKAREVITEFSPEGIVGRLTNFKKGAGQTPVIEASRVSRELLKADSQGIAKIENLERTLTSLRKAGPEGKKAIGNLQGDCCIECP